MSMVNKLVYKYQNSSVKETTSSVRTSCESRPISQDHSSRILRAATNRPPADWRRRAGRPRYVDDDESRPTTSGRAMQRPPNFLGPSIHERPRYEKQQPNFSWSNYCSVDGEKNFTGSASLCRSQKILWHESWRRDLFAVDIHVPSCLS